MEGPSLFLAKEQLKPFAKKTILKVDGNTKFGKERLLDKKILDIFCWGKHLVFQFDTFAFRVHFLLYGSFEANLGGKKVTGDYPRKNRLIRLKLILQNGEIDFYSCSIKFIESLEAIKGYDFSIDIMSKDWDEKKALNKVRESSKSEIADVLLDQTIFAGVGNIIKNEVLFLTKISPLTLVKDLSLLKLKLIIKNSENIFFAILSMEKKI